MRTRRPRSLIRQDGYDLAFCHLRFRKALSRYIDKRRDEGTRITQTQLCQNIADHLYLSQDSIDNYRKGYNGPATETNNAAPLTEYEKASAWLAVRDVYKALQVFVSFFEGDYSIVLDLNDTSSDPVIRTYNYCWKVLHRNSLDIPDQTYEKLEELIKELGYWIYGVPEEPIDDGIVAIEKGIRMDYFANLFALDLSDEMEIEESEWAERVTSWLVDDFYDVIRRILRNYIPREPAVGMGCPQKNPCQTGV